MAAEFTRLLFRQGAENERPDVLFKNGEPAYTTDYKRLFIGDGATLGGIPVGMKFLGFCEFDDSSNNVVGVNPGYTGDIVFETTTNLLYVLSGNDFSNKLNYVSINKTPVPDNLTIYNNDGRLSLIENSLHFGYFASFAIGRGLEKNPGNTLTIRMRDPGEGLWFNSQQRIAIKEEGVTNNLLAPMDKDTVKARLGISGEPEDVDIETFALAIRRFLESSGGGSVGVPIGAIIDYGGAVPPINYLPCDGGEYPTDEFPELAAALGSTWGLASLTSFYVPNLNGRATIGAGANFLTPTSGIETRVGSQGGSISTELQRQQIPKHHHEFRIKLPVVSSVPGLSADSGRFVWGSTDGGPDVGVIESLLGFPHSNLQPSSVVLKCIKAK
jgi:hypothetical protein